ncbi:MAG: ATP-binding protein [Lachnospiraceae bacterium]|nr:ATP-binding protein [Lachnospiraceae bacterium]
MGEYLNPGNDAFASIRKGNYVDKTDLIDYINGTINTTPGRFTSFSRPRRFGKSFAAKMLCAYYDKSCDSRSLFSGLKISKKKSFDTYLNKYDVIYLDMIRFVSNCTDIKNIVKDLQTRVIRELKSEFPEIRELDEPILPYVLSAIVAKTNSKFIIIIDEWDALFREAKNDFTLQEEYVQFLRGLFKGGPATDKTIAAAYMTGILPIKKYGTQSALTDFKEFTMTKPAKLAKYVGFTEAEVKALCSSYHMDFENMCSWYDGYSFNQMQHVYNPNSVMNAIGNEEFGNYWTDSESYESLKTYISMNFDGLRDAIISMLGGEAVRIRIGTFQNDFTSFKSKDDVLTLLIHLGYLRYDALENKVSIPNKEVAEAFADSVSGDKWEDVAELLQNSENLLDATLRGDSDTVAEALEKVHALNSSVLRYNNEASLSCAIMIAYYTARRFYKIVPEFPEGKGFADLAFLPGKDVDKPAMIIELKYDKNANTAIKQIHDNKYDGDLKKYFGNLLLVGINYDKDAKGEGKKRHTCTIEKV